MSGYFDAKKKKGYPKKLRLALLSLQSENQESKRLLIFPLVDQINEVIISEDPSLEEISYLITLKLYRDETCKLLIEMLPIFDQKTRNATSSLLQTTTRRFRESALPPYLIRNPDLLYTFIKYFELSRVPELTLISEISHILIRACIQDKNLTKFLFTSGVFSSYHQFLICDESEFDRISTSFSTYNDLILKHLDISCEYLAENWDICSFQFKHLLNSRRTIVKKSFCPIFYKLLLSEDGRPLFHKFIVDSDFLIVVMSMMISEFGFLKHSGYAFFKLFVLNPRIPVQILVVLKANKENLNLYLREYQFERPTPQLESEKNRVLEIVQGIR